MSAEQRSSRGKLVGLVAENGSVANPSTASDGIDLSSFDRPFHDDWLVEVMESGGVAVTDADISIWGYNAGNQTWFKVWDLNGGATFGISIGQGYSEIMTFVGYTRMAVSIGSSTGAVNVDVTNLLSKRAG